MVLRHSLAVFALFLAGCITARPVVRAPNTLGVATALVRDSDETRDVVAVPETLAEDVRKALDARNLKANLIPPEVWANDFATRRTTQFRLQSLAAATQAELLLLVETKASFYSLLNGRFRWTVHSKATIAKRESLGDAVSTESDFPVFLDFDFQREAEALAAAQGTISDDVGRLADQFLSGTLTPGPSPKASAPKSSKIGPGDSIYFVMVDRFYNGDPSNDGEVDRNDPQAFHGGDLQGVLDKLDYIQDLGFTTVWLSPVFQMRTAKFEGHGAFHGYWVEDMSRVEPRFGDEALLKKLSDELHRRGMKLVLDIVLNHVAYDAPLVKQHPEWFHHHGDIKDWNDRAQLENNDVHGLPDLAQEKEEVYQYLLANSVRWIDAVHPDGFRLDAVKHVPLGFWARYNEAIREHAGADFFLLGEDLDGNPERLAKTLREGKFTSVFDFPLYFAAMDVFCDDTDPRSIGSVMFQDSTYEQPAMLATLVDNHDLQRVGTRCRNDRERIRSALTFTLTTRGIPVMMYGVEYGMLGSTEPEVRGDLPSGPAPLRDVIRTALRIRREAGYAVQSPARVLPEYLNNVSIRIGDGPLSVQQYLWPRGRNYGMPPAAIYQVAGDPALASPDEKSPRCRVGVFLAPERQEHRDESECGAELLVVGVPANDGDRVVVVGSSSTLGNWKPETGLRLRNEGNGRFRGGIVQCGIYALKFAIIRATGEIVWENHSNRFVSVDKVECALGATWSGDASEACPSI